MLCLNFNVYFKFSRRTTFLSVKQNSDSYHVNGLLGLEEEEFYSRVVSQVSDRLYKEPATNDNETVNI